MEKDITLPDLGEGIEAGDLIQVLVAEGDMIAAEQAVIELETDKAVLEVPCPYAGKVVNIHVSQGDKVAVGAKILTIETDVSVEAGEADSQELSEALTESPAAEQEAAAKPADREKRAKPPRPAPGVEEPVPAGPSTRRLARELGVDLGVVAAANPGIRLTEEQVKDFVRSRVAGAAVGEPSGVRIPDLPDFEQWGPVERVRFTSLQRKTAEYVSAGWHIAPHVTQFDQADITELEALRKRYRESHKAKGIKLTVTPFVLKALIAAFKEYPQFNSSLDTGAGELVLKRYYHIGVAVDTPEGLIVPVIRDVDQKEVLQLAAELNELAERTRERKVGLDELRGGTFTLTNLGGIGGTAFSPIINYPEVAILGLSRAQAQPVVKEGQVSTRLMLPICLSYDHRVINGADGARFCRRVATLLEDPELLLLEG
ncbi:MAG: 2-oxo acid dehydrogenase subunit E2 [Planctomycetota bacterium]